MPDGGQPGAIASQAQTIYEFGKIPRRLLDDEDEPERWRPQQSAVLYSGWFDWLVELEPLDPDEMVRLAKVLDQFRLRPKGEDAAGQTFDLSNPVAREAFDKLVVHNLRLVRTWVPRIGRRFTPMEMEDLFQAGCAGLMRAVEMWDWQRGYAFSTYAVNWIKQSIFREGSQSFTAVRLPVHVTDSLRRHREDGVWLDKDGTPIDLGITGLYWPLARAYSIEDLCDNDLLEDLGFDAFAAEGPEAFAEYNDVLRRIVKLLKEYTPKQQSVIRGRLDLGLGDELLTLEEIGQTMGVTRERIRQIETKALATFLPRLEAILTGAEPSSLPTVASDGNGTATTAEKPRKRRWVKKPQVEDGSNIAGSAQAEGHHPAGTRQLSLERANLEAGSEDFGPQQALILLEADRG